MFSNRTETPSFRSFNEAMRYVQTTKPIARGPNKGTIPLATNRRNPNTLNIYVEKDKRNMQADHEPPQYVVRCRYYQTDIVSFFEDGAIEIHDYSSASTRHLQDSLLPFVSVGGDTVQLYAYNAQPSCDSHLFQHWHGYIYPFADQPITLIPATKGSRLDKYTVTGHGYFVGPGRKVCDPLIAKFLKRAQRQCRDLVEFSGDHVLEMFEGCDDVGTVGSDDIPYVKRHLHELIDSLGWKPGDHIPNNGINALLKPLRESSKWRGYGGMIKPWETYLDRMRQWAVLRWEVKDLTGNRSWPRHDVVTEREATRLLELTGAFDRV